MLAAKPLLLAVSLLLLLLAVIAFANRGIACRDFFESKITVADRTIVVALADTSAEQQRGLSGCDSLPDHAGMLFTYSAAQPATFWMKDMLIPIDIVWIRDGAVIGIDANVPPPHPRTPDAELPLYRSPSPVTAVLELAAGKAATLDIKPGSSVE